MSAVTFDPKKNYTPSQIAAKLGVEDTTAHAKVLRRIMRANFDTIAKLDPTVAKAKERANDGNRWTVNGRAAAFVVAPASERAKIAGTLK
jgi:hypothetical protein